MFEKVGKYENNFYFASHSVWFEKITGAASNNVHIFFII